VKKALLSVLSAAVLLGAVGFAFAQGDIKPLVTASFAGYDKLKTDIALLGKLGGNPQLADGLEMMLKMMTQGKGLTGLDTKRPWGFVNTQSGAAYGFIPVTDLKQLMETAKANPALSKLIKADGDVYEVQTKGPKIFVQQKGTWAVVASVREGLANAPADPLKLLGNMPTKYDLAVRVSISNIPEQARQMFLMQLQMGVATQMAQKPGERDSDYAARKLGMQGAIQVITALANDLDEVLLGWTVDAGTSTTALDLEMTAKSGTPLAERFALIKAAKTKFAGVKLPGAAVAVNGNLAISDADLAWANDLGAIIHDSFKSETDHQGLPADKAKLLKDVADDIFDVWKKTLESKKVDGGYVMLVESGAATVVFGEEVADGAKLEAAIKKIVENDPEAAGTIKLNVETYEGVRFHTIAVPANPKFSKMFGENVNVVLGIADDKVLVAVGRDAAKTLKKVIDGSKAGADKELPPLEIKLAIAKLAKFGAELSKTNAPADAQMRMAMMASALEKAGEKDHLTITGSAIPQGVRLRIEMEDGLLKATASVAQMIASMGMNPQGPPGMPPPVVPPPDSPPTN
jgi:hypothetical protein